MALISCAECSNQVSNTAAACPHCGAPIAEAAGSRAAGAPLTTTQETSKRLKVHILISAFMIWGGLGWSVVKIMATTDGTPSSPSAVASLMFMVGFVWYLTTKIRIWWHHK